MSWLRSAWSIASMAASASCRGLDEYDIMEVMGSELNDLMECCVECGDPIMRRASDQSVRPWIHVDGSLYDERGIAPHPARPGL